MKKGIQTVFFGLIAMLNFAVSGSAAERLVVNIPFDFKVGDTSMTSGTYTVGLTNGSVLKVTRADGRGSVYELSNPNVENNSKQNILVFHRYGGEYFLSEVIWAGDDWTRKLLPGRTETEMARNSQDIRVVKLITVNRQRRR